MKWTFETAQFSSTCKTYWRSLEIYLPFDNLLSKHSIISCAFILIFFTLIVFRSQLSIHLSSSFSTFPFYERNLSVFLSYCDRIVVLLSSEDNAGDGTQVILFIHYLRSWALLQKPPDVQLLKNFPPFGWTRRFITVPIKPLHWPQSWDRLIQSIPSHPISLRSNLILHTHLGLGLPSDIFPSDFRTNILQDDSGGVTATYGARFWRHFEQKVSYKPGSYTQYLQCYFRIWKRTTVKCAWPSLA
jgi:hypothetical protein